VIVRSIYKPPDPSVAATASVPVTGDPNVRFCKIPCCSSGIKQRHLMCAQHWFEVPLGLRDRITQTLHAWLEGEDTVVPYFIARLEALIHVGKLHSLDVAALEAQLNTWRARQAKAGGSNGSEQQAIG